MKAIKSLFLALALMAGVTTAWADASGTCGATGNEANVTWSYVESTHTLTISGTGAMANYASNSRPWYDVLDDIETVIIEDGVTSIGDYAFISFSHITSVDIPNSVTTIGVRAFSMCYNLSVVHFGTGLKTIEYEAFYGYNQIISIVLPDGLTTIEQSAFSVCSDLRTVVIPNSVTRLGTSAFGYCSSLTDVYVSWSNPEPSATLTYGVHVFENVDVSKVNLHCPGDVPSYTNTSHPWGDFKKAPYGTCGTGVSWDILGDTLTISGTGAMDDFPSPSTPSWCTGNYYSLMKKIVIAEEVTYIGERAFYGCPLVHDIYVSWDSPVPAHANAFGTFSSTDKIHVPAGTADNYNVAPWNTFTIVDDLLAMEIKTTGRRVYYNDFWNAVLSWDDIWEENSTLKLLAPVEITDRIEVTNTRTLDLNGYGIKSTGDHEVIFINGGNLTLEDSNPTAEHKYDVASNGVATLNEASGTTIVTGGYITGGRGNNTETRLTTSVPKADGGAIFMLGSTLTMNGGTIIGNTVLKENPVRNGRHGGGIFLGDGSHFTMNGGKIMYNRADLAGGGVSVYSGVTDLWPNTSSVMEMNGGEISNNYSIYNSAGIHVNSYDASLFASVYISGGRIENNHVEGNANNEHCAAFGVASENAKFYLSGNPVIQGNTFAGVEENIYLYDGQKILINGPLTDPTHPLPITMQTSGVCTSGLSGNGTVANFAMENSGTYLVTSVDGEAAILGPKACTANVDPKNADDYYSTFYHSQFKYELPAGVEAYKAERSGSDLILTKIAEAGEALPYGTAVILKATGAALELIPTDAGPVTVGTNELLGKDAPEAAPANCYVLSGHSSDNSIQEVGFYQFTGTLAANKAYMIVPPGASPAPKHLRFVFDSTTDIESPSLQGRSGEASKILRDGQLIIIRNGVEYNANGQMIK